MIVRHRVADVDGQRPGAVGFEDGPQHPLGFGERVVPGDFLVPAAAATHHGTAQSVGIVVQVPQGHALGAQVSTRPDVVGVATDAGDTALVYLDAESAHGLAQRAGDLALVHVDPSHRAPLPQ